MAQAYDRKKLLQAAAKAQGKKRRRKAIALYRRMLAVEAGNGELHAQLAPLLAATRQPFDAWQSFRQAGRAFERESNREAARAIYAKATEMLPREMHAWLSRARIERELERPDRAMATLLEGSKHFRSGGRRPQAIHLLRRARQLELWYPKAVLELAVLLAKMRQREEALMLLDGLAPRVRGPVLKRVRGLQVRLRPTPGNVWSWMWGLGGAAPARKPAPASAARQ